MMPRPTHPPVPTSPHPPRASVHGLSKAAARPSTASPLAFLLLLLLSVGIAAAPTGLADERMLRDLAAGDAVAAAAGFSPTMRENLDPGRLLAVWSSVTASLGELRAIEPVQAHERDGMTVRVLRLSFARGALDAQVASDADGVIHGLFFRPAPPPSTRSSTDDFVETAIETGAADWPLPGTLTVPAGAGPFPALVLVHGSGPNDRDLSVGALRPFRDIAQGLARRGIASLRYDKRTLTHGARLAGETVGITLEEEVVADALAALGQLGRIERIDAERRFVLGISLGALVAPRIAARALSDPCPVAADAASSADRTKGACGIAGILMLAPSARPLQEIIPAQVRYLAELDGSVDEAEAKAIANAERLREEVERALAGETVDLAWTGAGPAYWRDLAEYDALATAASLPRPILLLQGERDYQVTVADDFGLWKAALDASPHAELNVLPKLNHLFVAGTGPGSPAEYMQAGAVDDAVLDLIAQWVHRQTGGKP